MCVCVCGLLLQNIIHCNKSKKNVLVPERKVLFPIAYALKNGKYLFFIDYAVFKFTLFPLDATLVTLLRSLSD